MEVLVRHLGSIVLALLLGPIVYVLTGVGLARLAGTERDWYQVDRAPVLVGLGALAAAGILYAVLVLARLSPLGPFLVGLGYLGLTAWGLSDSGSLANLVPERLVGVSGSAGEPAYAVALLLALPLLATVVIPRRWRRSPDRPAEPDQAAQMVEEGAAPAYPSSPAPFAYPGAPVYTPPTTAPAPAAPTYPPPEPTRVENTGAGRTSGERAGDSERTTVLPPPNAPTPPVPRPTPAPAPAPPAARPTSGAPAPGDPSPTSGGGSTTQTWPVTGGENGDDAESTRKLST
jgi:hypothetical protein